MLVVREMVFKNREMVILNGVTENDQKMRKDALDILTSAVKAVNPKNAIKQRLAIRDNFLYVNDTALDLNTFSRIYVIGGGKAGGAMAEGLEDLLGDKLTGGVVNVLKGTENRHSLKRIELNPASHPLPDHGSVRGVEKMLSIVDDAGEDDLIIALISGGGSALMTKPAEGVDLKDFQKITELILRSGATINELNTVRKHLSDFKGGQLARRAYPSRMLALILSDVVGDPVDTIASGPTAPDKSTFDGSIKVIRKKGLWNKTPKSVRRRLEKGKEGLIAETPKPGDEVFKNITNIIIGSNFMAAKAAQDTANHLGYRSMILSTMIEGESKHIGAAMAGIAREILSSGNPVERPAAVISGGETTVTVSGSGVGGRNQELALGAVGKMQGLNSILATLATDGIDGPTDAAGAIVDGRTFEKANEMNLDVDEYLSENDSYSFFNKLGDLLLTDPTGTNVNDITIILVS
jgi:glycerate-2-kinase